MDLETDIAFLVCLAGNISVHLYFLVKDTVVSTKAKCQRSKKKGCCCCKKTAQQLFIMEKKNKAESARPLAYAVEEKELSVIKEEDEDSELDSSAPVPVPNQHLKAVVHYSNVNI